MSKPTTTVKARMVEGDAGVERYLEEQLELFAEINMLNITTVAGKPVQRKIASMGGAGDGRPQIDMVPVFLVVLIGRKR